VHGVKGGDRSVFEHASRGFRSYVDRASKRPLLTAREDRTLSRAARGGCKRSQGKLVERNLLLYISGARKNSGRGLPLRNLVQEGSLELIMRAAEKFDPQEGYRFSTYATF
jgi:DNA-directed RNA polymerase sigma subunit (sigma70/sigma32)